MFSRSSLTAKPDQTRESSHVAPNGSVRFPDSTVSNNQLEGSKKSLLSTLGKKIFRPFHKSVSKEAVKLPPPMPNASTVMGPVNLPRVQHEVGINASAQPTARLRAPETLVMPKAPTTKPGTQKKPQKSRDAQQFILSKHNNQKQSELEQRLKALNAKAIDLPSSAQSKPLSTVPKVLDNELTTLELKVKTIKQVIAHRNTLLSQEKKIYGSVLSQLTLMKTKNLQATKAYKDLEISFNNHRQNISKLEADINKNTTQKQNLIASFEAKLQKYR